MIDELEVSAGHITLSAGLLTRPDGTQLRLSATEVDLLRYLGEREGAIVTRDELLVEVWGYSPKVVSRAVDSAVRRLRLKIETTPDQPRHLLTVFGNGYRFLTDRDSVTTLVLSGRSIDLAARTVRFDGTVAHLGDPETEVLTRLVDARGRPVDRAQLAVEDPEGTLYALAGLLEPDPASPRHLIQHGAYVLLRKPGDPWLPVGASTFVGRTTWVEVLTRGLSEARHVTLVGLGGVGKSRLVAELVERLPDELQVRWVQLAGSTNAEGVRARIAEALRVAPSRLDEALASFEGLLVLDDCREPVDTGLVEVLAPVRTLATSPRPLGFTDEEVHTLHGLEPEEAATLFASITGTSGGAEALLEELDGLPLAIELAARRARQISIPELTQRMGDRFRVLSEGSDRHGSLDGLLQETWSSVGSEDQQVWTAVSLISGSFHETLVGYLMDGPIPTAALSRLSMLGVLVVDASTQRLRMPHTLREFARPRIDDTLRASIEERRCAWAIATARAHRHWSTHLLTADLPSLRAAWTPDPMLTRVVADFVRRTEGPRAALALCDAAQAEEPTVGVGIERAISLLNLHRTEPALAQLNAVLKQPCTPTEAAMAWVWISRAREILPDHEQMEEAARRAVGVAPDGNVLGTALNQHALALSYLGHHDEALATTERALHAAAPGADTSPISWAQVSILTALGRLEDARQVLRHASESVHPENRALTQANLIKVLVLLGELEEADRHAPRLDGALKRLAATRNRISIAYSLILLRAHQGRFHEVLHLTRGALDIAGPKPVRAMLMEWRALALMATGEPALARSTADAARRLSPEQPRRLPDHVDGIQETVVLWTQASPDF